MVDRRSWVCLKQTFLEVADGLNSADVMNEFDTSATPRSACDVPTMDTGHHKQTSEVPLRMVILKDLSSVMLENYTWPTLAKTYFTQSKTQGQSI